MAIFRSCRAMVTDTPRRTSYRYAVDVDHDGASAVNVDIALDIHDI